MTRRKKNPSEKTPRKTMVFSFRMHPDEWAHFAALAAEEGRNPTQWARLLITQRRRALSEAELAPVSQNRASRSGDARDRPVSFRIKIEDNERVKAQAAKEGIATARWAVAVLLRGWQRPVTPLPQDDRVNVTDVAVAVVEELWPDDAIDEDTEEVARVREVLRPYLDSLHERAKVGWDKWQRVVDIVDASR